MNENRIQRVLEIEKQAQEVQDQAKREAQEIPVKAEQEAQALIAKAVAEAHEEARKMLASAQTEGDSGKAADEAAKNNEFENSAKKNFDRAVAFVLDRVLGGA